MAKTKEDKKYKYHFDPAKRAKLKHWARHTRPTRAERRFRDALKGLNCTYEKQRIFLDVQNQRGYIADFYIPDYKLVFEVDGYHHLLEPQKSYDEERSRFLATQGIKVIRFLNKATYKNNTDILKEDIEQALTLRGRVIEKRNEWWHKRNEPDKEPIDTTEMKEQFFANGGTITKCPNFGYKRRIYKYSGKSKD